MGEPRPLEQVPLEEIANAMAAAADASAGLEKEEALREALGFFGGTRLTEAIRARLELGFDLGITSGRLTKAANGYVYGSARG